MGVEFVIARKDRFELRVVLIAVNRIGTRPFGVGRRNVTVSHVDRDVLAGTEAQTGRIGDLRHRRRFGIEVVAAHGAFVNVHTHACRQPVAGAVLTAEPERERIGVVLHRIDRVDAQLLLVELHVERLVGRPADPLQIDGELPLGCGAEADAPRHGRRQRQLGREGSPIQSGNHFAAAGHRAQRVEQRKVLLRLGRNVAERRTAAAHLHIHARTP